jgi:formylglycine-generating enzyme required for sulfatase activity
MAINAGVGDARRSPEQEKIQRQKAIAERKVDRFIERCEVQYGDDMLNFACHVAFPLTLTTDVVYLLRQEYFPKSSWSIAAELLLSNLCESVGYDLYEMGTPIRRVLLNRLVSEFGEKRVYDLAGWMARYIQHRLSIEPTGRVKVLGHPSSWTALACLRNDDEVTQAIKAELRKLLAETDDPSERFRLAELVESHGDLLAQRGLEPLKLKELAQRLEENLQDEALDDEVERIRVDMSRAGFPVLQAKEIEYELIIVNEERDASEELRTFTFEVVMVNERGVQTHVTPGEAQSFVEKLPGEVGLEMVAIPSGRYWMGDEGRMQRDVTVPPFFLGRYAVTQTQWRAVASLPVEQRELEADPSRFKGENRPVEHVSWWDAQEFCLRLSKLTGREYGLPSEAQWEYACRAGTTTPFHFGETLTTELANYEGSDIFAKEKKGSYRKQTTPVGSFSPNGFGLYDMHGNVWEWCEEHGHGDLSKAPKDGSAWIDANAESNASRVLRGGSWLNLPRNCRSASRYFSNPVNRYNGFGFRVVCCAPRT